MRFAIAAIMTLFLVGTIFAQDATGAAEDGTQATVEATDAELAPDDSSTADAPLAADAAPATDTAASADTSATEPSPAPAPGDKPKFGFKGGINLGSDVLPSGANDASETWTVFGFQPDLSYGKIGIGLDLTFHFMLYQTSDTPFKLYPGDWVPAEGQNVFDVYLPKFLYVRYGLKGEDPIFAKLGSINDLSLGNGFIMSDYSNMLFLPKQRIFGLDFGLDGRLFGFPYVGIELLTGNLARFDVIGARVYARPLIDTSIPLLKNLEAGASVVMDTNAYLHDPTKSTEASPISAYGVDAIVPLVGGKAFPMAAFTEFAIDPNNTFGWMLGLGGRLISLFTYGAQLRVMADGFIPSYFDANYDIYRSAKYDFMKAPGNTGGDVFAGWFASLGTSLLADKLVFNAALDGPLSAAPATPSSNPADYPHLRAVFRLEQLPKIPFYFDASYEKYNLGRTVAFFKDLVDPTDAVIGMNVNYQTGASVLTLAYNAKWVSADAKFDVTSSLKASMKF